MNILTRRLIAVTATTALLSVPAITLVGNGGSASASNSAGDTAGTAQRAAGSCRVATPAGLLDDLLGLLTGGGTTSPGASPSAPPGLLDQLQALLNGSGSNQGNAVTGIVSTLQGLLPSGGSTPDVQTLTAEVTALLQRGITTAAGLLDALTEALKLPPELMSVFPAGLPDEVTSLLNGELPSSLDDLVSLLATALNGLGLSAVPTELAAVLHDTPVLAPLLTALATVPTAGAQPTVKPVAPITKSASPCTTPSTTSRCATVTAKTKALKHRLKVAKKRHQHAKVKVLKKKLAKAKRAKRIAC